MKHQIVNLFFFHFLLITFAASGVFAQESFRVGDAVETSDGKQCRVESITGASAKVRCGPNRSDIRVYSFQSLISAKTAEAKRARQRQQQLENQNRQAVNAQNAAAKAAQERQEETLDDQRRAFWREAKQFENTVHMFQHLYNPAKYKVLIPSYTPDMLTKGMSELAELDVLCSKHVGVTNVPKTENDDYIREHYADWCALAAKRSEIDKVARVFAAKSIDSFYEIERQFKETLDSREGFVNGGVQMLIYEPEVWKRRQTEQMKPRFTELGVEMPADYFAGVEKKAADIKKIIDQTAPTRSFTAPPFQDAPAQAIARREFAKTYPGIQILKIGSDYATWKVYKNSIGIPTDRYKRGWALVKVPKRPYCQAKEWVVKQTYTGGGTFSATVSTKSEGPVGGIFMRCG